MRQRFCFGQEDVIRVETPLVTTPARVVDRNGRYVGRLKSTDFVILENGIEQKITFFTEVDEPFTVLLLLDRSGSLNYRSEEVAAAASLFTTYLRPTDSIFAASFADSYTEILPITKVSDVKPGIRIIQRRNESNTYLFDAVDVALMKLAKIRGRKALVLFSDGAGTELAASVKSNLRDAEEGGAIIYTVRFDTFGSIPAVGVPRKNWLESEKKATSYMSKLADVTGGSSFRVENISELGPTFRHVAEELGRTYVLGYSPNLVGANGERRKITVKVNIPNVAVRSRNEVVFKRKGK